MSTPTAWSIDEALALLARKHGLRAGDTIMSGTRFSIAYGGATRAGQAYLLLDEGHIIQRREIVADPNLRRCRVGGYVGGQHIQHRLVTHAEAGMVATVEDAATRDEEELHLCVAWPGRPPALLGAQR